METIAISKFKAQALAILEEVRRTGEPVLVTRFGKPVAEIVPPSERQTRPDWIGSCRDTGSIVGDIVSPVLPVEAWEAHED